MTQFCFRKGRIGSSAFHVVLHLSSNFCSIVARCREGDEERVYIGTSWAGVRWEGRRRHQANRGQVPGRESAADSWGRQTLSVHEGILISSNHEAIRVYAGIYLCYLLGRFLDSEEPGATCARASVQPSATGPRVTLRKRRSPGYSRSQWRHLRTCPVTTLSFSFLIINHQTKTIKRHHKLTKSTAQSTTESCFRSRFIKEPPHRLTKGHYKPVL